jgi:prepilin-type N-terminal cleavage/methylation domain-containing protein
MPHPPPVRGPSRPRPAPRAGYSLMEVLLVLVLIGIMLVLATPRMNLSPTRTEAAVHALASTLMAAQRAAVSGQHDVVVAFDEGQRRVRVHHDVDNDGAVDGGEPVRLQPLEPGVTFGRGSAGALAQLGARAVSVTGTQGALPAVTFNRSGSASEEGGAYLTTPASTSPRPTTARAVVVDRATGRAVTWRYAASGWERKF